MLRAEAQTVPTSASTTAAHGTDPRCACGATLPDLMKRAGLSSVNAAQVSRGRDAEIAGRMSELLGR
jgi:hypothetical protein